MAGKFAYTISANFCNVEADTVEVLKQKLMDFVNDEELPDLIDDFVSATAAAAGRRTTYKQGVENAKQGLGGEVVSETTSAAAAAPVGEPEVVTNQKGTKFTYNHPDAPELERGGRMVLMEGKNARGPYKGWVDPVKGPKPATPVDEPEATQWVR